jgi:hypothetical protein
LPFTLRLLSLLRPSLPQVRSFMERCLHSQPSPESWI